ncbi:MAG: hypothetical protein K6T73_06365 [Candidatus Bathyarchaeota archaeon]|nr:hypothetical protein [Candidatus Bathyarchaeota archaeon]
MRLSYENVNWLIQNSSPQIRYRVYIELLGDTTEREKELLKKNLLSDNLVQLWLRNLRPNFDKNTLHSGKSEAFENAMGKLYEFGLRKGEKILDKRTEPFRLWLAKQIHLPNEGYFPVLYRTIVASFLSMAGYSNDDAVETTILKRLETIYTFAKEGNLNDVYIPQDSFSSFPKNLRGYPLINPDLYPEGDIKLPWIYDIYASMHSSFIMEHAELRNKVETIIAFILKPEYQKLHQHYGVIYKKPNKYYVVGWNVHLPGYFQSSIAPENFGYFMLMLNLMSRSKTARKHQWFTRSFSFLEKFRTEDGLILFPRNFLPEKKFGYWIAGKRMGLEVNRRIEKTIKCESMFRYLEIAARIAD